MSVNTDYDVLVIGAGPAGENIADITKQAGLNTAVIERELVGGECSYWACMPSKALLRPGEAIDAANRTPGVTGATLDVEAALERRNALASNWDDDGQVQWLKSVEVDLIRGHGRLTGERTVAVEHEDGSISTYLATTAVVIATGTGAAVPPIQGLREIRTWANREITTIKEVPARLLVLGGGVVGVEMAQAWKTLGSEEVTVIEMADQLLPREEGFVGDELAAALERIGIRVMTGATLTAVSREAEDAPVHATVKTADGDVEVVGDEIVVAVGRRPLTADVGIETVGLEPGRYIAVDDQLRATGVEGDWLYVVGDANGRALLTHTGKYQARIAGLAIGGNTETTAWGDIKAIPRVVFTNPQIAAVGLTERDATDAGHNVHTVNYNTGWTAASAALGKGYGGTARLVIDADTRTLLGASFVGPMVGEMLHAATIAIVGDVTIDKLWHAIPSFPTISEIWLRFLEEYRSKYDYTFV